MYNLFVSIGEAITRSIAQEEGYTTSTQSEPEDGSLNRYRYSTHRFTNPSSLILGRTLNTGQYLRGCCGPPPPPMEYFGAN